VLINVVTLNFENNGGGDAGKRRRMYERLAELRPHLVLRQEEWDSDADGRTVAYEAEEALGLRCWLGARSCTAVYADRALFAPVREWPETGPMWVLPPTALTLRYVPAGADACPIVVVSYHLNYASSDLRAIEAQWLTTWNDKKWTTDDGRTRTLPALMGGDNNSYAQPGAAGGPPLPALAQIQDRPHHVHRSHPGPQGARIPDTRPDEILRTAGMDDVAHHLATTNGTVLAATVEPSPTQGPGARIDRIYASTQLLPAVVRVEVLDMAGFSDHHAVLLQLDADTLTGILK
jgi:endonuclease/exonuclease/phosphatase family metal-dependent hydrolase